VHGVVARRRAFLNHSRETARFKFLEHRTQIGPQAGDVFSHGGFGTHAGPCPDGGRQLRDFPEGLGRSSFYADAPEANLVYLRADDVDGSLEPAVPRHVGDARMEIDVHGDQPIQIPLLQG
jgi:hypothetical protein